MEEIKLLAQAPLFAELSRSELGEISEISFVKEVQANEIIFFENDSGEAIYLISTGMVKISKISDEGREKTLTILESGDFFGEMALLDGGVRSATAQALRDTRLLLIYREDFLELLHNYPEIGSKIIAVLSQRLRETNRQLENAHFKTVTERVKNFLMKLAREKGKSVKEGTLIEQKLTHQELGNLVGTSRESVTRTLNKLQEQGWLKIEEENLIIINMV